MKKMAPIKFMYFVHKKICYCLQARVNTVIKLGRCLYVLREETKKKERTSEPFKLRQKYLGNIN